MLVGRSEVRSARDEGDRELRGLRGIGDVLLRNFYSQGSERFGIRDNEFLVFPVLPVVRCWAPAGRNGEERNNERHAHEDFSENNR